MELYSTVVHFQKVSMVTLSGDGSLEESAEVILTYAEK